MRNVSLLVLGFFLIFSTISCSSDEAESDNDSGLADNETVTDNENATDDMSDEILTESDETTDETTDDATDDATDDGTPDETVDDEFSDDLSDEVLTESEENDEEVTDDALPPPSSEALTCCQEIVKEWFRCEGTYEVTAIQGCVDCFAALSVCADFYIAENSFGCSAECDAICEGTGSADNSGKDRRKVADGYCLFIMDKNCDIAPEDVSSFGVVDGLDASYDE
ncbi:MAG TPA: hypothetical protein PKV35_05615 [bacterium]|nr:hypothetical protein [bacterium]